ncbi:hypothetical protein AB3S75_000061 [Citrus x aurantiifolia]
MIGRKKMGFFNDIKLKVLNKIAGWQHKMLSSRGKEILIKAATQAIPTYAMSVFKLLRDLCDDIQRAIAKFWWGSKGDKHRIHWRKWEKLSQAKIRGGLGFREFTCFNQALVAKQAWRLLQYPNSLVLKVLQARYYRNSSFLCADAGANASYIWRSILWGRQVIKKGLRWRIGNGKKIAIFSNNWLPRPETFRPIFPPSLPVNSVVADLIKANNQWDEIKLRQHFMAADTAEILKIPFPAEQSEDEVLWHYNKRGNYSVKSGYQLALRIKFPDSTSCSEISSQYWSALWSLELPEKLKIFMWRASNNLLPPAENLWKRKVMEEPTCQRCKRRVETISHALLECKAARKNG